MELILNLRISFMFSFSQESYKDSLENSDALLDVKKELQSK